VPCFRAARGGPGGVCAVVAPRSAARVEPGLAGAVCGTIGQRLRHGPSRTRAPCAGTVPGPAPGYRRAAPVRPG
jgi:hypothetical protein